MCICPYYDAIVPIWRVVFRILNMGFEVKTHPYFIIFDSTSIQSLSTATFPKNACLFSMVAQLPGRKDSQKQTKFNKPFYLVKCTNSRNLAGMFNDCEPKSTLLSSVTRLPFPPCELSTDMMGELIYLFCPNGRLVFV